VRNIGLLDHFIHFFCHKLGLVAVVFTTLALTQTKISIDIKTSYQGEVFNVQFTEFSPAFAAFEDEFLFEVSQDKVSTLKAGSSDQVFSAHLAEPKVEVTQQEKLVAEKETVDMAEILNQFDGEARLQDYKIQSAKRVSFPKETAPKPKTLATKTIKAEELAFGSLVAMVNPQPQVPTQKPTATVARPTATPGKPVPAANNDFTGKGEGTKQAQTTPDRYKVSGGIQLRQGLAFFGSMEVSWVVGDYELQVGSINAPDATYEIEVNKLIGDVIISLYDNRDELIGEGVLDLTTVATNNDSIVSNIKVYPIDWDVAGEIINADSLGSGVKKPVSDVEVALYAFNEATQSSANGVFSFYNWKKSNSRTLAIASKEGFKDSIFTLDSKTEAQVLLFEDQYMDSYFQFLSDELEIYDVAEMGTIYGEISGISKKSGYTVKVDGAQPIYITDIGFATRSQNTTSENGLFSFAGLQDGDYELLVEKDGEVLDQRIVVVEQGKVSPVLVDLSKVSKHIEFFDPMQPEKRIDEVEVSFFDGSSFESLDQDNQVKRTVNRGHDASLMEFATTGEINRTLISRNKGLQKVPFINDTKLTELAKKSGFDVADGLLFGFVDSDQPFQVSLAESTIDKIIYFNKDGLEVKKGSLEVIGFIIAGFQQGLNSLIIDSLEDEPVILGTDLIYSDHQSVSVTHLEIVDPN
jgi:hypothetical protein